MKKMKSPNACVLALSLSALQCIPSEILAAPDTPGQRAGEVSRVIPAVSIARGVKTISASAKTVVDWLDVVNTQASARARVALDDGSVLNVGSDSSIKVLKHDGGAQQTELELTYGKIRSQAQKITKPDGKFEVRTPAGVAGVVGTDFFTGFDNSTGTMNVIVFEGIVKVCNLAGVCVIVKAGQMTSVRSNDSTGPQAPTQATLDVLVDAGTTTDVGGKVGVQNVGHHIGKGTAITLGILAVIPAILIPVVATHGNNSAPPNAPPNTTCKPNSPACG
jgi:ferric-dicitrate binding protein FerR (iron transport regulator)